MINGVPTEFRELPKELQAAIYDFCNENGRKYRPEFKTRLQAMMSTWVPDRTGIKRQKQEKEDRLLAMAKANEPKPHWKSSLGGVLHSYTNPTQATYDPIFDKKIRELRPDWFVTKYDKAQEKKNRLLAMALAGDPRPTKRGHPLGPTLNKYTNHGSGCYNSTFDKKIRELRPDWFVTKYDKAQEKKNRLLAMAKTDKPRPHRDSPLGEALHRYTAPKRDGYNPTFDKKIRELRPDWFINKYDKAQKKKDQLLVMAKTDKPRPASRKHPLGGVLSQYTNLGRCSYDPIFDKKIRELRPDWFEGIKGLRPK
jgi:hypothetical protein